MLSVRWFPTLKSGFCPALMLLEEETQMFLNVTVHAEIFFFLN